MPNHIEAVTVRVSDIEGVAVPEHIQDFVDTHAGPARQLTLRLA